MTYDLLIKGGHLLDPGQRLDGRLDIGITAGRIAAIQSDIPSHDARQTLDARGANRHVVPGLINIHTHVAYGATTAGVGMVCADPDFVGVASGVTTQLDAGSVGVANIGVFPTHILPRAKTRTIVYVNAGSHAHTMPGAPDVARREEVDRKAIAGCVEHNPGLVSGVKLRLVGPVVKERGEEIVRLAKDIATEHRVPLMIHIGDPGADRARMLEITRFMLKTLGPGDILTHYCTPGPGSVMDEARRLVPEVKEARANGVVLDACTGRSHFGIEVARRQAEDGLHPDTISTDSAATGRVMFLSLTDIMSKYMAVGYPLSDVVRMTTTNPARAAGMQDEIGAIAVGREADLTILDDVIGRWKIVDNLQTILGDHAVVPIQTVRAGVLYPPAWGPRPWGWLPEEA